MTFEVAFLEYGPTGDRVSDEQLLDPNYYSLFIARDQDSFFDNDESAAKVDGTLYFDSGFWTEKGWSSDSVSAPSIDHAFRRCHKTFRGSPVQISQLPHPHPRQLFCISAEAHRIWTIS